MDAKNFVFIESWVDSKMTGMKTTFLAIFDSTWTHILAAKGPNKEFLIQNFYYHQFCDFKTDYLK